MKDMNRQSQNRVKTMRRLALGLLAALSVTAGTVAVPLAGTADAGGARGGVDFTRDR